jgi:hypothetical protein
VKPNLLFQNFAVNYRIFNRFDGFFDSKFYFPKRLLLFNLQLAYPLLGVPIFLQYGDGFVQCNC